jgi:hypothetical protein
MDVKTRRVIAHCEGITLTDVQFQVSQSGREKVLREKKKNVHAFIIGTVANQDAHRLINDSLKGKRHNIVSVTYNPYLYSSFVVRDLERPIYTALFAVLNNGTRTILARQEG